MLLKNRWYLLYLSALTLLAGIALVRGLNGDCPICSEADEYCYAPRAIYMVLANTLNPGWFANPASTLIYPLELYYKLIQWYTHQTILNPAFTPEQMCAQHMTLLVKWPRLFTVFVGLATIPLVFSIGRRWLGASPAILGTFFYALSPLVIRQEQMLRTDPLANFFVYLFFLILSKFLSVPTNLRLAALAAIAAGLALSTRYFGLALAVPFFAVLLVLILRTNQKSERFKLALSGLVFGITLFLTFAASSPYVFLDFKTTTQDLLFEQNSNFVGIATNDMVGNLFFYLSDAFPTAIGPLLSVLAIVGLIAALFKRDRLNWALLLYLFTYGMGVCANHRHWNRWILPVLPIVCLLSGLALTLIYRLCHEHLFNRSTERPDFREILIGVVVLLLVASYPMRRLLAYDWQKRQMSPQAQGFLYLKDHIAAGTKIALDGAWDYPDREKYRITTDIWRPDFIPPRPHNYFKPADLARDGYRYMLVQTWLRKFYQDSAAKNAREADFYASLQKQAPLLFTSEREGKDNVYGIELEDRKTPVEIYDLTALRGGSETRSKN